MIRLLEHRTSERKVRLFGCACCRRIWHLLTDGRSRAAVEASQRFADGLCSTDELQSTAGAASAAVLEAEGALWAGGSRQALAAASAAARTATWEAARLALEAAEGSREERLAQCSLLRDLFHPFYSGVVAPAWRSWNGGAIALLAQAIYDDGGFDRLPILADMLEDAGCADRAILDHCRGPGPHIRGCWIVDRILGKE
jgi:hypothetical protein